MYCIYLFLTKNNASKNPSLKAITFLHICMKLGYLWFHTLAQSRTCWHSLFIFPYENKLCFHALLPKRNCLHKWSFLLHQYRHYFRWV